MNELRLDPSWRNPLDREFPTLYTCFSDGRSFCVPEFGAVFRDQDSRDAFRVRDGDQIVHQWHRRGIGRLLLNELIERARTIGHHILIGGACTEQVASIKLLESFGFEKVAHFSEVGHKFGRWLDVSYFRLSLASPADG